MKGLNHARAVQRNLNYNAWVRVWNQGIFHTGSYPVEDLIAALDDADFGAFLFLPEDILIINSGSAATETKAVRDNVLFELGMFIGRLGRDRTFLIKPRSEELHLPSDLAGMIPSDFNDDPNLDAALGPASGDIIERLQKLGGKKADKAQTNLVTPGYDREAALKKALLAATPLIRGRKLSRSDVILPSGDVQWSERLEGVESFSNNPVERLPTVFTSSGGLLVEPRFESLTEGQQLTWVWREPKKYDAEKRDGFAIFTPPLKSGHPVSFKRERYIINAISFTQRERLDVTRQTKREESIRIGFLHVFGDYVYQLVFPERRFPSRFRMTALTLDDKRDDEESAFAERQITELPATRTLLFNLPNPLPGYRYELNWELPEDDGETLFNSVEKGFVEEMAQRLLALRTVNKCHTDAARHALSIARQRAWTLANSQEKIEACLYVYDRQASGLTCVASLDADIVEKQWKSYLFKPGRGIVGYAFRQRQTVPYVASKATHSSEPDRFEVVTDDDREHPASVLIAVPLFYSGHRGRSVGIITLTSRAENSILIPLAEDAAKLALLSQDLGDWYGHELAEALGVIASSKFWAG